MKLADIDDVLQPKTKVVLVRNKIGKNGELDVHEVIRGEWLRICDKIANLATYGTDKDREQVKKLNQTEIIDITPVQLVGGLYIRVWLQDTEPEEKKEC